MEKLARKDAVKELVKNFDDTVEFWTRFHPSRVENPDWQMPVVMPFENWKAIIDALRPLAED